MKDINGGELRERGMAMLLCEVVAIEEKCVHLRVMNSDLEIAVGAKHDEVLGGLVADSELTAFEPAPANNFQNDDQADGVKTCQME